MSMSNLSWDKNIVFVVDPRKLLPMKQQDFHEAKLFQDYSFKTEDGCEFPSYHTPLCGSICKAVSTHTLLSDFQLLILMRCQCVVVFNSLYKITFTLTLDMKTKNREDV